MVTKAFHTAKAGLNQSGRLVFHFRMVRSVKASPADAIPMNPTTGSGLAVFGIVEVAVCFGSLTTAG